MEKNEVILFCALSKNEWQQEYHLHVTAAAGNSDLGIPCLLPPGIAFPTKHSSDRDTEVLLQRLRTALR